MFSLDIGGLIVCNENTEAGTCLPLIRFRLFRRSAWNNSGREDG